VCPDIAGEESFDVRPIPAARPTRAGADGGNSIEGLGEERHGMAPVDQPQLVEAGELARRSSQNGCAGRKTTRSVSVCLNSTQAATPPGAQYSLSGAPEVAPVSTVVHCQPGNCRRNSWRRPPSLIFGKQFEKDLLGVPEQPARRFERVDEPGELTRPWAAGLER
jgi:hypothetical protein